MEHAAKVGIGEAEYWESSPRYVAARIRGQRAIERIKYESGWEQARLIAWTVARQNDRKEKFKKPTNFLQFPWEKGGLVSVELDEETRAVMMQRLEEEAAKFFGSSPTDPLSIGEGVT
jgi:hypothetical protein